MAITHSYVDYGAGSDATGDGTIGTPWKTLQKAFDTLTRNTTDGNQVNLKAGTAHVNAAALDLTTFIAGGALAPDAPLILRGYTSAANDGGIGEINCNGATMWASSTYGFISHIDLKIHNFGDNSGIYLDDNISLHHCEISKGASSPSGKMLIRLDRFARITDCYIHDVGSGTAWGIYVTSFGAFFAGNYVVMGSSANSGYGIAIYSYASACIDNIVVCAHTGQSAIVVDSNGVTAHNIVYNSTAGTGYGIYHNSSGLCNMATNNIVIGWSGAGGDAIASSSSIGFIGYNAFYNNTNVYTIADQKFLDLSANDVALAADPFTDAANGDFSLTAAAKTALAAKGWPTSYLGAHANTVPNLNIGPIQMAAGGAAGGGFPILGGSVVR